MSLTDDMTPDEIENAVRAQIGEPDLWHLGAEPPEPEERDDYTMVPYAEAFAVWAHGDQLYGDEPYRVHLAEVVAILDAHGYDVHYHAIAQIIGWLHDVDEDTAVTHAMLATRFGDLVADGVWACTGVGANRREKQAAIHVKLLANPDAQPPKASDRLANMRAALRQKKRGLVKMYAGEFDTFITSVHTVAPSLLAALHEVQAQSLEFLKT